jgi:hypothetical protein
MNKIALLGLRLVALLLLTPLCYFLSSVLTGDRAMTTAGGTIVAFLPPVVTVIASMYAIQRALFAERFGRTGRVVFHVLNVTTSLLLAVGGFLIAFVVQIGVFGE